MIQNLPALVTLLTVLLQFGTMYAVGKARGKYGIAAPAVAGHPAFERAYRVQMNTLENTVMFLPVLWLAANYGFTGWAGLIGMAFEYDPLPFNVPVELVIHEESRLVVLSSM